MNNEPATTEAPTREPLGAKGKAKLKGTIAKVELRFLFSIFDEALGNRGVTVERDPYGLGKALVRVSETYAEISVGCASVEPILEIFKVRSFRVLPPISPEGLQRVVFSRDDFDPFIDTVTPREALA